MNKEMIKKILTEKYDDDILRFIGIIICIGFMIYAYVNQDCFIIK